MKKCRAGVKGKVVEQIRGRAFDKLRARDTNGLTEKRK